MIVAPIGSPPPSGPSGSNEYEPSADISEPSGNNDLTGIRTPENADKHGLLTALTAESADNGYVRVPDADLVHEDSPEREMVSFEL